VYCVKSVQNFHVYLTISCSNSDGTTPYSITIHVLSYYIVHYIKRMKEGEEEKNKEKLKITTAPKA